MGPPPFGDGKPREPYPGTRAPKRFNGATAFRRWKGKLHPVDAHDTPASMGPPPFGDGKIVPCIGVQALDGAASMGPLPFGDGKRALMIRCGASTTCFNGATAFRRWKGYLLPIFTGRFSTASMGPPPFGDGKTGNQLALSLTSANASMGPPPFGDGKVITDGLLNLSTQASMGPPPFGDGKLPENFAFGQYYGPASMGPPPFGDGKFGGPLWL